MNIDVIRFFAIFLMIANHTSPFIQISPLLDFYVTRVVARITVPLFLMITGYFVLHKDTKHMMQYTKKICIVYGICILLYIPINLYMGIPMDVASISKMIFVEGTMYHLWYFPSLILGMWIVYGLLKVSNRTVTGCIVSLLYVIGLFGDSYYGFLEQIPIVHLFYTAIFSTFTSTRNGLFFAPIFLYMGYLIYQHPIKCNKVYAYISFICMSIEGLLLHHFNVQQTDTMYLFLLPTMYFAFSYWIQLSHKTNRRIRMIATMMYILHPMVIVGIRFITRVMHIDTYIVQNNLVMYVCVTVITCIISIIFQQVRSIYGKKSLDYSRL